MHQSARRLRRRSETTAVLALVLGLLAAACGNQSSESGVNVRSLATELVYGVPETPAPAPPADTNPIPEDPAGVVFLGGGDVGGGQTAGGEKRLEPIQREEQCPETPPEAFPVPAGSVVENQPEEGEYLWQIDGDQFVPELNMRIRMARFAERKITDVGTTQSGFEFTTVQRELVFGSRTTVHTTYEVRQDAVAPGAEDGVYLTKIVRDSPSGEREFNPSPAVLMLPLPIEAGVEFQSVGIDPVSLEVLRIQGAVPGRHRVDACGERVDSWLVDGQQEFVSSEGEETQRDYDYGVATQFGGMIVFEHVASPCGNADANDPEDPERTCTPEPQVRYDAAIGQVEPDPLD